MKQYVCGYVLHFSDGGEPEEVILHRGTQEDCGRILGLILAVSYSGTRAVDHAEAILIEESSE